MTQVATPDRIAVDDRTQGRVGVGSPVELPPDHVNKTAEDHVDTHRPTNSGAAPTTPRQSEQAYNFETAFSRNIGWVTEAEQQILRAKRIAIAGLGGVGGAHLLTLARMGVGAFNISDLDRFELVNFNRQRGATISNLDRPKVDVLAEMALGVNRELDIRRFGSGISAANMSDFLDGVDLYIDGLDFFAVEARRLVFAACAEKGIPAITAAPLGMGVALLNFMPGKMTFEQYFRMEGKSELDQLQRFFVGLAPARLQARSLVDPATIDLANHRGPSTPMGCALCAGVAGSIALKILLKRGKVPAAPWGLQFDAYRNKLKKTWRPGGNFHPLQQLALLVARRKFSGGLASKPSPSPAPAQKRCTSPDDPPIKQILDLARWAPSGDNVQQWRFEIRDDRHVVIHGRDTRDHCVYDLRGHASQIGLGTLLETIAIAATGHGLRAEIERREDADQTTPTFDVRFIQDPAIRPDPLIRFITSRTTQRRAMRPTPLLPRDKQILEQSVGPNHRIFWLEGWRRRWRTARLLFRNAHIRLTIEEAYRVHREVIQWNAQYSTDKMPDQALGLDPLTTRLMRWSMRTWQRVQFLNRYFNGTLLPRLELDLVPGLFCGAHFMIVAHDAPWRMDDFVDGGRATQRFWLTATSLGLQCQPETTPLIFYSYVLGDLRFCESEKAWDRAQRLSVQLEKLVGREHARQAVFMGRIGAGSAPMSRSLRKPLESLIEPSNDH